MSVNYYVLPHLIVSFCVTNKSSVEDLMSRLKSPLLSTKMSVLITGAKLKTGLLDEYFIKIFNPPHFYTYISFFYS